MDAKKDAFIAKVLFNKHYMKTFILMSIAKGNIKLRPGSICLVQLDFDT